MSEEIKQATTIYARVQHVICPHCSAENDGWVGDPRSIKTECDECKEVFVVAPNADIKFV